MASLPVLELSSDTFLLTVLVGGGVCMEAAERLAESIGSTSSSLDCLFLFVASTAGVFLGRTIEALGESKSGDSWGPWETKSEFPSCSDMFRLRWLEGVVIPNLCGVFRISGLDA